MPYRADIDGLRALSVLAVVLYHAQWSVQGHRLFAGGFIGVDVFFVISGYLISGLILHDLQQGRFSLWRFYERRIRRLLPALFTVMLISTLLAWRLLLPDALQQYAGSLLAALLFGANIWFWQEDSYTAEPSALKPLLHTWSLSVEEQFYLLFPLVLMLGYRRRSLGIWLLGVALLSLLAAHWSSRNSIEAAFYLLPMRAWELLAGVLLMLWQRRYLRRTADPAAATRLQSVLCRCPVTAALPVMGLIMIVSAMLGFDDQLPHPSLYTLMPVIGTLLVLHGGHSGGLITTVLSQKPLVGLGLISYSLYLWHQPVFALARNHSAVLTSANKAALILLALVLALLTYWGIERPCRYLQRVTRAQVLLGIALAAGVLAMGALLIWAHQGYPSRLGALEPLFQPSTLDATPIDLPDSRVLILNLGDSHAGALAGALRQQALAQGYSFDSLLSTGLTPVQGLYFLDHGRQTSRSGPQAMQKLLDIIQRRLLKARAQQQQVIIIYCARFPLYLQGTRPIDPHTGQAEQGNPYFITQDGQHPATLPTVVQALTQTLNDWMALGAKVVLVYPVPEMVHPVPERILQSLPQPSLSAVHDSLHQHPIAIDYPYFKQRSQSAYALFDALGDLPSLLRIYPEHLLCQPQTQLCIGADAAGIYYRDDDHLSDKGAQQLVQHLFPKLLKQFALD